MSKERATGGPAVGAGERRGGMEATVHAAAERGEKRSFSELRAKAFREIIAISVTFLPISRIRTEPSCAFPLREEGTWDR